MRRALLALGLALVAGCTSLDWPASQRGSSLPGDNVENGPTHRAGQPCLFCHGQPLGARDMVVGGTVYRRASDAAGVAGATVTITDATGATFTGTSNRVGNIFLQVGGRGREGEIPASSTPVFPLQVSVTLDGIKTDMRSEIGREGSCAVCHAEPAGAATVGKIWAVQP